MKSVPALASTHAPIGLPGVFDTTRAALPILVVAPCTQVRTHHTLRATPIRVVEARFAVALLSLLI